MTATVHVNTPQLSVIDSRGLAVRHVAYCRRDVSEPIPESRVTAQQHDAAGWLAVQRDPRFLAPAARPNMTTAYSLSGKVLLTDSVDAGWRLGLPGEAGAMQEAWDGRGSYWQNEYDKQQRPVALHEQTRGSGLRTLERLTYAGSAAGFAERNQCGQLIRHDHSAGVVWFEQQALNGGLIRQIQRFLPDLADVHANWPAVEADRDQLLQPGAGYTTESQFGPLGEVLMQTDAGGHRRHFSVDRAGQLQRIDLTLKSQTPQPLLKAASYNAKSQLLTQITGNDVISSATYEPSTGRLERITATTSKSERLQELSYEYDPVGNIVRLVDHTQPDTFFANQRVQAQSNYTYDSLYQLICAKGRKTVDAGQNPGLPELIIPCPIDPGRLLNYTEHYEYDKGGNRTELRHVSDKNPFKQLIRVDPRSNRALPWNEGEDEPDFERNFDENGNLQCLLPGAQPMIWDAHNQLQGMTNVRHSTAADDGEWYRYNAAGERAVKFTSQLARAVTHKRVVHYLPGVEMRTTDDGEELQVICVPLARGSVRCLHWVKGIPNDIDCDQLRYTVDDHSGSCVLEVDKYAAIISQEGYYPYGGTAWWAARSRVDADYKTIRYSGKERDSCGLYYYGFRYLAPWLGRWLNPDPVGNADGLNLYTMVGNNPVAYTDPQGHRKKPINKDIHLIWVGDSAEKLADHMGNINNTVKQADGYKVHLYLDTENKSAYSDTIKNLNVHSVTYLKESKLFKKFQKHPAAPIYNDFRSGDPRNFAFAVDVLRAFIVWELGGMYSDVDDVYASSTTAGQNNLGGTLLMAEHDELLTFIPNLVPWENESHTSAAQINNSSFAAHPRNAVLKDAMNEMVVRYNRISESYKNQGIPGRLGAFLLQQYPETRMARMSGIVGPRLYTDVIKKHDTEMNSTLSQIHSILLKKKNGETDKFDSNDMEYVKKLKTKMPLDAFIKSGGLGSWQ